MPQPSARRARRPLALWAALICWATLILWLSSLTPQQLPDAAFVFWDKANHFLAFTVGGWLAASALHASHHQARVVSNVIVAVILIAAFGVLDEALQTLTPGRTGGDFRDWVADLLGAALGAFLSLPTRRRLLR